MNQEASAIEDMSVEVTTDTSQNNARQSTLDLITSVNPTATVVDGDISLYNDKGGKYIVSIQKEQSEKGTQHDVNIYSRKGSYVLGFTDVKEVGASTFTSTHSKVTNTISESIKVRS